MKEFKKYYAKNNIYTSLYLKKLEGLDGINNNQLIELYNKSFISLFRHATTHSKFYIDYYGKHGIDLNSIKDLSDINKLPLLKRTDLKDFVDQNYTGINNLKIFGLTSGTTGTPLKVYRTLFSVCREQAYIRQYREKHGYQLGQPLLSIRGVLGKDKPYEFFKKANILYISSPNINKDTIQMYYELVRKFNPVAVEAYPSYLFHFSNLLEKSNLPLNIPQAFTSSETLLAFQREKIEPYLNTTIHDWYGNAERTILLAQDDKGKYYPPPLYSINEFDSNQVITTSLINKHFPLIRYVVDDKIVVGSDDFYTNLISPEIIQIEGRIGDNILLKDGSVVGCVDHAFKGINHLEMAQVHQYDLDTPINIKIVVNSFFNAEDENQLKKNWIRLVGENNPFHFTYCNVEDLTHIPGKKFRLIIKKKP
jgi:phenylacetate-CoA ligase